MSEMKPMTSNEPVARGGFTARGLIDELVRNVQDLDAEVAVSFANSDGMQISGVEVDSETSDIRLIVSPG